MGILRQALINLRANRRNPPLAKLAAITDAEEFVWQILPHAARTFAVSIVFLPGGMARALAVAYLYCRMLDTFEDLPSLAEKESKLRAFLERFGDGAEAPAPAPTLAAELTDDPRESTYVLLVQRAGLVDQLYMALPAAQQAAIRRLVRRMGEGMIWAARTFAEQGGELRSAEQLTRYCHHVLGNPLVFAEEMQRIEAGQEPLVEGRRLALVLQAGEAVQLANITRDIEKDYDRGVFYHPGLPGLPAGPQRSERIRQVRQVLLRRGMERSLAFSEFVAGIPYPSVSRARGACLLLILLTYSYYQGAAQRAALGAFASEERWGRWRIGWWGLRGTLSAGGCRRALERVEQGFRRALQCVPSAAELAGKSPQEVARGTLSF